jgi:hypothetical protein
MSFADFIARMKAFQKNADVIFDREEPIGAATDLVLPRRRWFRKTRSRLTSPAVRLRPINS